MKHLLRAEIPGVRGEEGLELTGVLLAMNRLIERFHELLLRLDRGRARIVIDLRHTDGDVW